MTPVAHRPSLPLVSLRAEVIEGLSRSPRSLPTKLLYDARGARLFQEITELPEYYVTRTELEIFRRHLPELAGEIGPDALIVEPGSGSGVKTRLLLDALERPVAYVPVDIASGQLKRLAEVVERDHPGLAVTPVVADYTRAFRIPVTPEPPPARTAVFFPGSTIGNFEPGAARAFLARLGELAGPGGALILGTDLLKPAEVLLPAYDDARGVTAAFNLNVLRHLNRVLGTEFRLDRFRHAAVWVPDRSRIEMRLVSLRDQSVTIPPVPDRNPGNGSIPPEGEAREIRLRKGEPIVTEHSYKHAPETLDRLVREAGWRTRKEWRDGRNWFSLRLLVRSAN